MHIDSKYTSQGIKRSEETEVENTSRIERSIHNYDSTRINNHRKKATKIAHKMSKQEHFKVRDMELRVCEARANGSGQHDNLMIRRNKQSAIHEKCKEVYVNANIKW